MLRLGKLTDYATVILSYMARDLASLHTAIEIAVATGITQTTVSKILKMLVKAKVLNSIRGAKGGYILAKTPDGLTVADIISALEGPIALTECSISHQGCEQASGCGIRGSWGLINRKIYDALESITLADMILPINTADEVFIPVTTITVSGERNVSKH